MPLLHGGGRRGRDGGALRVRRHAGVRPHRLPPPLAGAVAAQPAHVPRVPAELQKRLCAFG
eukprot:2760784-Prymnesium_polylepis.1